MSKQDTEVFFVDDLWPDSLGKEMCQYRIVDSKENTLAHVYDENFAKRIVACLNSSAQVKGTSQGGSMKKESFIDHNGKEWIVPQILGRLKCGKIPSHGALREFVIHRDGYKCKHCGESNKDLLVADHIISRRNGGSHHPDNLQCLCWSCNSRKSKLFDAKWGKK